MKKAIKKMLAVALALALAVTVMPAMSAKAADRNYQWGPFNVSNAKGIVTLPADVLSNISTGIFADNRGMNAEILVVEDSAEIGVGYDRMGWKPEDFVYIDPEEDEYGNGINIGNESYIYQTSLAIGDLDDGWSWSMGGSYACIGDFYSKDGYWNVVCNLEDSIVKYDDGSAPDYWVWCFCADRPDKNYYFRGILLHESEYDVLKKAGMPLSAIGNAPSTTPSNTSSFKEEAAGTVYRFYDPTNGDHIFTVDKNEAKDLVSKGWLQEKSQGKSAGSDGVPVYRLTDNKTKEHLFTADKREKDYLAQNGWSVDYDGKPAFYGAKNGKPVYRLFNPKATNIIESHLYTLDQREIKVRTSEGWTIDKDGKAMYYLN